MRFVSEACEWLVRKFPGRSRVIRRDGEPYLLRFYITKPRVGREDTQDPEPFGLYLHYFYQGDEDKELHNHPWKWALSFILSGGYLEEREDGTRLRSAGRFNLINSNTFHRVTSPDHGHTWTLFMVGPRVNNWGFKDTKTGQFWPWRKFLKMKGEMLRGN